MSFINHHSYAWHDSFTHVTWLIYPSPPLPPSSPHPHRNRPSKEALFQQNILKINSTAGKNSQKSRPVSLFNIAKDSSAAVCAIKNNDSAGCWEHSLMTLHTQKSPRVSGSFAERDLQLEGILWICTSLEYIGVPRTCPDDAANSRRAAAATHNDEKFSEICSAVMFYSQCSSELPFENFCWWPRTFATRSTLQRKYSKNFFAVMFYCLLYSSQLPFENFCWRSCTFMSCSTWQWNILKNLLYVYFL